MLNPLRQFIIKPIIKVKIFGKQMLITNSTVTLLYVFIIVIIMIKVISKKLRLKPHKLQSCGELVFNFMNNIIIKTAGSKAAIFFPYIFSIFIIILMNNLVGMIPINFSATSHISTTLGLAIAVFIVTTVLGFIKNGKNYFTILLPKNTPKFLSPLIFIIETIVYFSRPISLSVRLAANITAGHVVLKVLATFTIMSGIIGVLPLILLTILTGFELIISVLQAYIFSILACVYLNEALNLH